MLHNRFASLWVRRGPGRVAIALIAFAVAGHGALGGAPAQAKAPAEVAVAQRDAVLDLNTATAAELRALPGMGAVYVKRIIDGRPYSAKNQLLTRGILPQAAYERIRDLVVAHRTARR